MSLSCSEAAEQSKIESQEIIMEIEKFNSSTFFGIEQSFVREFRYWGKF